MIIILKTNFKINNSTILLKYYNIYLKSLDSFCLLGLIIMFYYRPTNTYDINWGC